MNYQILYLYVMLYLMTYSTFVAVNRLDSVFKNSYRYDKSLSRAHTTGNDISSELAVSLCHFARPMSLARLLRYLKGTAAMGLLFKPFVSGDLVVTGWSDASFALCLDTGRSFAAFFFSCGSGAISWKSKFLSSVILPARIRSSGALHGIFGSGLATQTSEFFH